jgi:hypothetical protein
VQANNRRRSKDKQYVNLRLDLTPLVDALKAA